MVRIIEVILEDVKDYLGLKMLLITKTWKSNRRKSLSNLHVLTLIDKIY